MCGITGYFSRKNDFQPELFARANNLIRHRGPDGFGYASFDLFGNTRIWKNEYLEDYIVDEETIGVFGFRRLSIIDLSVKGSQPMCDSEQKYWIVYNGEIYNYIEIRQELLNKGYQFKSRTDTEVILNAYAEWGEDCVGRFNGMWAFCIFDSEKGELFCSRDRLGVKPFYYYYDSGKFVFASEIKQLNLLVNNGGYNKNLVFDFLALGSYGNHDEKTYFNSIKILPAAHILRLNLTSFELQNQSYWSLENVKEIKMGNEEVYETLKTLLTDSITLRLRSDVAIGTAFSGGLDSSGIVCILNRIYNGDSGKNKVFTIVSNDSSIKDPYYADLLTNQIPVTNYKSNISTVGDLNHLSKFIWHQEEPLQTASILGSWYLYHFMKSSGVTVAIDGQGADELMGGYYNYPFKTYFLDLLRHNKTGKYFSEIKILAKLKNINPLIVHSSILKGAFVELLKNNRRTYFEQKLKPVHKYLNDQFFHESFNNSETINSDFLPDGISFPSKMKADSYVLSRHTNLPGILRQVDRNSMAASVESRIPFLDYRIVEFLFSLSFEHMYCHGYTKYAYRKSMEGLIPDEVLWRQTKEGFKMPEYDLLIKNKNFVLQVFNDNLNNDYVNTPIVRDLFLKSIVNKLLYNNIIWRTLNYLLWKEIYK